MNSTNAAAAGAKADRSNRAIRGEKNGDIEAEFFEDCTAIPDPTELNPEDKMTKQELARHLTLQTCI